MLYCYTRQYPLKCPTDPADILVFHHLKQPLIVFCFQVHKTCSSTVLLFAFSRRSQFTLTQKF